MTRGHPLPLYLPAWPLAALEEMDERSALVADGCKLPQRSAEAERRAEEIVRARHERGGDEALVAALPPR